MASPKSRKGEKRSREGTAGKGRYKIKTNTAGLWKNILKYDEKYSKMLGVCATEKSSLGQYRPLMKLLEISCHGIPWFVGTVLVFIFMHKPNDVEILVNLFLGLLFDIVIVALLKLAFRRERPRENKRDMFVTFSVDNFSFPSGHATRAAFLACFFAGRLMTDPPLRAVVLAWSVCVSTSRIVLGRHHISDVICGLLIGLVEYSVYCQFWVNKETCLDWLESYYGHVHL